MVGFSQSTSGVVKNDLCMCFTNFANLFLPGGMYLSFSSLGIHARHWVNECVNMCCTDATNQIVALNDCARYCRA